MAMCLQRPTINSQEINQYLRDATDAVYGASASVSCGKLNDAECYLGEASQNLTSLRNRGIGNENKQVRELSTQIQNLNYQVAALFERQKKIQQWHAVPHVAVATKTLFPIRVTYDAGFGNTIELRGTKAAGLSWEQGKALICKDATRWELDLDYHDSFEYKLVLRKADGSTIWEKLDGDKKNRVFSIHDKAVVDYLKPIIPIFEKV